MNHPSIPQVNPTFVTHNLALGGAQTAVLRYISALPEWVRERTTLYSQSDDMPLLDPAEKAGFTCGNVTREAPTNPSSYFLSYGNITGLPERPTSLVLPSWDDAGWRFFNRAYGDMRGMTVAGVSPLVLDRYAPWMAEHGHTNAGILPPPVTEFTVAKGNLDPNGRIIVAWMGRPIADKGILSLPYLLKLDPRIVIRAWTGSDTAGLEYTLRVQSETLKEVMDLARKLGVADRLDIRPLDFNPMAYKHRLEGAHVLLGNSKKEGFLLTAGEALSCGIPVVVTKSCGIAQWIKPRVNGYLIDWSESPKTLAKDAYRAIQKAVKLDGAKCLASVANLSLGANYAQTYRPVLAHLTHTRLQNPGARVTVGVRVHQGTDLDCLDDAISSVAMQTYRRFKVMLLVDGPWSFGEKLAQRYDLPLICTGKTADIENCSWLHRQAVAHCDTEFYKPLDYDDIMLPNYLERAVHMMDDRKLDVYGCLLNTLQDGEITPRLHWPNKPLDTMFTGNSDDNMLPHSSVLLRTELALKAGNYQERAVGLGADDYNLWYRLFKAGATFHRDDEVRHVVYRIHEKNSLNIRRARFGHSNKRKAGLITTGAAAASIALMTPGQTEGSPSSSDDETQARAGDQHQAHPSAFDPPHS
jgi:hypothetical protein